MNLVAIQTFADFLQRERESGSDLPRDYIARMRNILS